MTMVDTPAASSTDVLSRFARFATVVLVVALLYAGREIFIPIALGAFLAFVLTGATRRLEQFGFGRVLSALTTMTGGILILAAVGAVVVYQSAIVLDAIPQYRANIREKMAEAQRATTAWFGDAARTVSELQKELSAESAPASATASSQPNHATPVPVQVVSGAGELRLPFGTDALSFVAHPFITVGLALVLAFFFLYDRNDLRDRLFRLWGEAKLRISTNALSDASERVMQYLVALTLANAIAGAAVALGLLLIGVPNWLLWGVLTAVLKFVPFIGTMLAAAFPIALSLAVSESWVQPLMVLGWFIAVDLISSNVVEPILYGTRTGASPTAIIVSFVFWTWLWGPFGILLATPITVCLVALGHHIAELEFFATLLGDQPVFRPSVRLYQRVLSDDAAAAREIVASAAAELDQVELLDRVLAPAIGRVAADWDGGLLSSDRKGEVLLAVQEALETPDDNDQNAPKAVAIPTDRPPIVVWAAGNGLEDALLPRLCEVLVSRGFRPCNCTSAMMASDVDGVVQAEKPAAVLLVAGTPARAARSSLLQRRWGDQSHRPPVLRLLCDHVDRVARIPQLWGTQHHGNDFSSLDAALRDLSSLAWVPPTASPSADTESRGAGKDQVANGLNAAAPT
ncbi:MAG: AI-2E family transporter [Phycisphaerae bacterium]|nr:AI-2E family transporter [Phycisphaerae bacterium]